MAYLSDEQDSLFIRSMSSNFSSFLRHRSLRTPGTPKRLLPPRKPLSESLWPPPAIFSILALTEQSPTPAGSPAIDPETCRPKRRNGGFRNERFSRFLA